MLYRLCSNQLVSSGASVRRSTFTLTPCFLVRKRDRSSFILPDKEEILELGRHSESPRTEVIYFGGGISIQWFSDFAQKTEKIVCGVIKMSVGEKMQMHFSHHVI